MNDSRIIDLLLIRLLNDGQSEGKNDFHNIQSQSSACCLYVGNRFKLSGYAKTTARGRAVAIKKTAQAADAPTWSLHRVRHNIRETVVIFNRSNKSEASAVQGERCLLVGFFATPKQSIKCKTHPKQCSLLRRWPASGRPVLESALLRSDLSFHAFNFASKIRIVFN